MEACKKCNMECEQIVKLAVRNHKNNDIAPMHCVMVALCTVADAIGAYNEELRNHMIEGWIEVLTLHLNHKLNEENKHGHA